MSTFQVTEKIEHDGPYRGTPTFDCHSDPAAFRREGRNLRLFLSVPQIPRLGLKSSLGMTTYLLFRKWFANAACGTCTCWPLARSFTANCPVAISFSPTMTMNRAPAFSALSNDFFSRKLSSPTSAVT